MTKTTRYIEIINWIADKSGDDIHEVLNDFIYHEHLESWQIIELCEHYMAPEYVPLYLRHQAC